MSSPSAPSGARRELREQRRRRRRIVVAAVAGCALLAGGTAFALATVGDGNDPAASAPDARDLDADATPTVDECPTLSPDAPLDLWIGGDSLAGSLGPSLGQLAAETGVVQPQFDSRVSSGLTSPEFFDWPEHADEQLALLTPQAVTFVIGTNDAENAPTKGLEADEWIAQYETLVDEMMAVLVGPGRTVYWVGAPIMESEALSEQVRTVNDVAQLVAARHPEVTYVDAYSRFASPEGMYVSSIDAAAGEPVTVRAGDGVHFTPEGGDYLAEPVFALVDEEFCVSSQAVPGAAKEVFETEGSTRVPGTSREVSTPATSATTPTAPPTTSAPPPSTSPSTTSPSTTTTTTTATTTTTTTTTSPGPAQ